jgi:signal transduction histidine kinase
MAEVVERVRRITSENERLFRQLIAGERRFRGLARAVWKVQEEERRRLARDLHDGLGQTLTALKTQLERLGQKGDALSPELRGRLADSVQLAGLALNETRELSRLLRPPVLDDLGLLPALTWLARTLEERAGLAVAVRAEGLDRRLEPDLETLLFRLAQEALTNVLKHARVTRAELSLAEKDGRLHLRVADRGAGFDAAAGGREDGPGSGLRGMHDRVELFGGSFLVRSAPGEGCVVEVEIPLAEAAGGEAEA